MTHDDAFLIERLIASFADTSPVKQLETHATKNLLHVDVTRY